MFSKSFTIKLFIGISLVSVIYFYAGNSKEDIFLDKDITPKITFEKTIKTKTLDKWADDDKDGLTNFFEIKYLNSKTLFNNPDTDNNGIYDSDEDSDSDGLTNLEEQTLDTNPLVKDTDQDKLTDYDEVVIQTDPLNPDTDNDGILDGNETVETNVSIDSGISMKMTGKGNIAAKCSITENTPSKSFSKIPGLLSNIIDLKSSVPFEKAELHIPLIPYLIAKSNVINNLRLAYINYQAHKIEFPENQEISTDGNFLIAHLDHFSHYAVIDYSEYQESFSGNFHGSTRLKSIQNNVDRNVDGGIDLVLTIDSSGSMSENDPSFLRISAAKSLVDRLENTKDQIAILDFDNTTKVNHNLSSNFDTAKKSMDQIDAKGKTNISQALIRSIDQLADSRASAQIIILFSDGKSSVSQEVIDLINNVDIQIYTIGLGNDTNENLLKKIADISGGQYFKVSNSSDIELPFNIIKKATIDEDLYGLSDHAETNGMLTWLGYVVYSDPYVRDSDGDGLSDGEEIIAVGTNGNGEKMYKMISDPGLFDSDGDGVSDFDEINPSDGVQGGNPLVADQ